MNILKNMGVRLLRTLCGLLLDLVIILAVSIALPIVLITIPFVCLFAPDDWFIADGWVENISPDSMIMD